MLTGLAHSALCVPDVEAATRWYAETLGFTVLSPPYLVEGPDIERDMGELIPHARLKAAILGFPGDGDRVIEIIEYPDTEGRPRPGDASIVDHGLSHVGVICDDIEVTRRELEGRGVTFLTRGIASVARVRTTWCTDPWGTVLILVEKGDPSRPYYAQF
jgi:catechol 2,3-dioxygenase-like lactoylglutathione lyase family enzyme